jgi:hypothetical protein
MQNKGTKLVAHDGETVHFLSALLQDSISCGTWMLLKDNKLKILVNRVCWEVPKEIISSQEHIARLHSILTIENVISVKTKRISKTKIEFFSILSIMSDVDHKTNTNHITILLSKGAIHMVVDKFHVTMKDVSTYWLTPKIPHHVNGD